MGDLRYFHGFAAPDSLVGRVHSVFSVSVELQSPQAEKGHNIYMNWRDEHPELQNGDFDVY